MSKLACRAVQRWLQEPDSLAIVDARRLDRHLASCAECAGYRHEQVELDRLIVQSLEEAIGSESVRAAVHARLLQPVPTSITPRRWNLRRVLRSVGGPIAVLAPLALVAVLAALFVPQLSGKRAPVTPASAAWHLSRPFVGFPITLDPRHPRHLLVGAWGQVYESWNRGASWHRMGSLPPGLAIRDEAIDVNDPHRYLVAARHSVYVSDDAGRHWVQRVSNLHGAENMFLLQDPRRPQTFFLGPSVLWRSDDSGATWRQDGKGSIFAPDGIQSLVATGAGDLYTGIWAGGVALSRDGGMTWERRSHHLPHNVVTVALGPGPRLWAATDHGTYLSSDRGVHWRRRSPRHLFTTAVVDRGRYVLVGGNGALYRSTDGGRRWVLSTDGLPLSPYVYELTADSSDPNRVYASLNGDGVFRSDDAGRHWQPVDAGLPISLQEQHPHLLLFLRSGALWITDSHGTDPGLLTVDQDVRLASLAPDGGAAAYLAGSDAGWALRVVGSGGSRAVTLISGAGGLPRRVIWSPSAAHLAVMQAASIAVVDTAGRRATLKQEPAEQLLGWSRDGRSLLFWNAVAHSVEARAWKTGNVLFRWPGSYSTRPVLSANGVSFALTQSGHLWIGSAGLSLRDVAAVPACRPTSWSADGSRLLLACARGVQIRAANGRLLDRIALPSNTDWAPGSNRALLYSSGGSMWRWTFPAHRSLVVRDARPASTPGG